MNINLISKNFDQIWKEYCEKNNVGYRILGKPETSTVYDIPMMWAYDKSTGLKVLVIFLKNEHGTYPVTFVQHDSVKNLLAKRKIQALKLKQSRGTMGDFHFTDHEVPVIGSEKAHIKKRLQDKASKIDILCFKKVLDHLRILAVKKKKTSSKEPVRSVYTRSAGLPGLGKNRRN